MNTINISLTKEQVKMVDEYSVALGFASRSEFFRAILRRLSTSDSALEEIKVWPFAQPAERSKKKILNAFKKTKKYSPSFLKDLEEGLSSSDYFTK